MSTAVAPVIDPGKDRIRRNVTKMADAGASQEEIEAYLQHEGVAPKPQAAVSESTNALPRVPKGSLALDVQTRSESTGALPFNRPDKSGDFEAVAETGLALPLVAAQAMPGVERFEALAGQAGSQFTDHPLSYHESLDALRSQTDPIPTPIKLAVQAPALLKSAALLPFSPAKAGAAIGAADQALSADEMSPQERAIRTLVGAGAGGTIGKVADVGATAARVARTPTTAKTLGRLDEARAASARPLYDKANVEGTAATTNVVPSSHGPAAITAFSTPKVQALFQRPEVAEIASGLKQLDEFKNVAIESPEMLDGIYKVFSDRKSQLARRLAAVTPTQANLGRFDKRQVQAIQDAILDAADGVMPSYRAAVRDYAEQSAGIKAVERGHDALRSRLNRGLPMARSLKNTTPEAYDAYLKSLVPGLADKAEQGVLGATRTAFGQSVRKSGVKALAEAPDLLRKTNTTKQRQIDRAIRALILGAASP